MSDEHEIEGPFLAAALLCESVLQEKDGRLSVIRINNRFTITAGTGAPETMPPTIVSPTMLISLRAGFARGSYSVKVRPITPSGRRLPEVSLQILLEGDDRGQNLILPMRLQADEEGLYWLDVLLNERL